VEDYFLVEMDDEEGNADGQDDKTTKNEDASKETDEAQQKIETILNNSINESIDEKDKGSVINEDSEDEY